MIETSELIINADGSCFHLHVRPDQLADKVIMCGDPGRVDLIASYFDSRECEISSREFCDERARCPQEHRLRDP